MTPLLTLLLVAACEPAQVVDGFPDAYVGVGMELKIDGARPVVVRTIAGGSAAEAGIEAGDQVMSIDGNTTEGSSLGDVVMRIRGRPGSQVTLGLERGGKQLIVIVRRRKMAKGNDDYRAIQK